MDWTVWVLVGLFILAIPLLVVEMHIMRKPEAERTERERNFLRKDRAAARAQNWFSAHVSPWIAIGVAIIGLVVLIPLWSRRPGLALVMTVVYVVLILGALVLWVFVLRKRGRAWREHQKAQQAAADAAGHPRFFISGKAGLWAGSIALALGIAALVFFIVTGGGLLLPTLLCVFGVVFLVLGVIQFRAERSASSER